MKTERIRKACAELLQGARRAAPEAIRDISTLAGGSLIAVGTGMIYLPAGLIVGGLLLLGGSLLSGRAV